MRSRVRRHATRAHAGSLAVLAMLTLAIGQIVAVTPAFSSDPLAAPSGEAPPRAPDLTATSDEVGRAVVQEMAGLNATLQRIQTVLDRLVVHQELDLLMKRIDLKARRVPPLQSELRSVKSSIQSASEEITQMELYREQIEGQLDELRKEGLDESGSAQAGEKQHIETNLRIVTDRLETLQRRQIELENELAEQGEEIEILEDVLDERLGLR